MAFPPKTPPSKAQSVKIDIHTEQVVLAAMLVDAATCARLVRVLPADRWQVPEHRSTVVALTELDRRHIAYDPAAVKRLFPEVDIDYLAQLSEARPTVPQDLARFVEGVRWDALRVDAVRGPIASLLEALADPLLEPAKARGMARAIGTMFDAWRDNARVLSPEAVWSEMCTELDARAEGHAIFPYGIEGIDTYQDEGARPHHPEGNRGRARLVPAMRPGKITVLTGCSGSGKSTLACRIALGQARQKRRILYGAWEMSGPESLELIAIMSLAEEGVHVSRTMLQVGARGEAADEMRERVKARAREIGRYIRFIPNPFQRQTEEGSNNANLDIIEQLIEDMGADVFIADLWERCLVDDEPNAFQRALFRQQLICDKTKCHGVLLAQQRLKDIEKSVDKRPKREGIKGTSGWIDIGDTILGTFMPSQWKDVPADMMVVDILKQRIAPWPLCVELQWNPDQAWFGPGSSVPYDQPTGAADPSEVAVFTGGGRKGKGRHHG